jgi:N-acetylneuraminic acid mutarotase
LSVRGLAIAILSWDSPYQQPIGKGNAMKTLKSNGHPGGMLLILVLTSGLASLGAAAEGIWTKKADMATARYLHGSCAVDGKVYAIGGSLAPDMGISTVEEYDPETDTWTRRADMPTPRAGLGVSAVNNKIYAIGGAPLGGRTVEEYDPGTDTWTRKADMPTARFLLSTCVVGGKIYAIGGATDTSGPAFTAVEEYDPATDTWTRKANLPEPRYLHAAGVVDGKIYIIAGSWQAYTASRAVYAYDPATDIWERKADAPTARSWLSASVADGRIYVIGGDFGPPKANVEEYDPATDAWAIRADMPTPRGALSTTALHDRIYVIGGVIASVYDVRSTVEEYIANPLVVDFNGDGVVDIKDLLRLVESWGQNDPAVDIAPRPSGDGIVDATDLEILMGYWGQEIANPYLIAHWKLDETEGMIASDSAGEHDGTVIGVPAWQSAGGVVDGALEFDRTTFVITDSVLNPSDGPFSVFAWVKGGAPGQVVIAQEKGADWLMVAPDGALKTELKGSGRLGRTLVSSAVITDDAWHRIGLAWDGSNRILYVDDIEVARDTQTQLVGTYMGLHVGAGSTLAPSSFWSGLLDDVRIYNREVQP